KIDRRPYLGGAFCSASGGSKYSTKRLPPPAALWCNTPIRNTAPTVEQAEEAPNDDRTAQGDRAPALRRGVQPHGRPVRSRRIYRARFCGSHGSARITARPRGF